MAGPTPPSVDHRRYIMRRNTEANERQATGRQGDEQPRGQPTPGQQPPQQGAGQLSPMQSTPTDQGLSPGTPPEHRSPGHGYQPTDPSQQQNVPPQQGRQPQQGQMHRQGMGQQGPSQQMQQGPGGQTGPQSQRGRQPDELRGQQPVGQHQTTGQPPSQMAAPRTTGQAGMAPTQAETGPRGGQQPVQGAQQSPAPAGMHQPAGSQAMEEQGLRSRGITSQLQSVEIDDIIQTDVVTVEPDTPLATLIETLESEDVGSVVVIEDDSPLGIITDRKVALSLADKDSISDMTASDIMTEDLVTGEMTMTVFEVLDMLSDADIRRLPVVDEDGALEAIVTLDDILVLLGTEMQKATDIIKSQSPRL